MSEGILGRYWKAYGGFRALFTSVYFYLAIVLSALMFPAWFNNAWHSQVLSIIPSVLGFSLGGYALLIAIGDESFRALISGEENGQTSPFMSINASFVHFILMQLLSLIYALIASAYYFQLDKEGIFYKYIEGFETEFFILINTFNYIGYTIFIYALLTAFAATLAILRVSSWYDKSKTDLIEKEKAKGDSSTSNPDS